MEVEDIETVASVVVVVVVLVVVPVVEPVLGSDQGLLVEASSSDTKKTESAVDPISTPVLKAPIGCATLARQTNRIMILWRHSGSSG